MRHFAGLALLLVTSACAHIPDYIKVQIDGSTIEVDKVPSEASVSNDKRE